MISQEKRYGENESILASRIGALHARRILILRPEFDTFMPSRITGAFALLATYHLPQQALARLARTAPYIFGCRSACIIEMMENVLRRRQGEVWKIIAPYVDSDADKPDCA